MLHQLHDSLWEYDAPLNVGGLAIGHRMAVVRLRDGGLWIHSPSELTAETRAAVEALGTVRWIVAPSRTHSRYVNDWARAFPQAGFAGAPGLDREFPKWELTRLLDQPMPAEWEPDLAAECLRGLPAFNEVVFFHRPSRTLLVADLVFNLPRQTRWWPRFVLNRLGTNGCFACSSLFMRGVKEPGAFALSIGRILEWDFDRVLVGHGTILERGGREALRTAVARHVAL